MLKINVGFNRKVGEANYGSRGASVNLELDLDSVLIGEPERLKDRIRHERRANHGASCRRSARSVVDRRRCCRPRSQRSSR
jgi:hypothetical protein